MNNDGGSRLHKSPGCVAKRALERDQPSRGQDEPVGPWIECSDQPHRINTDRIRLALRTH